MQRIGGSSTAAYLPVSTEQEAGPVLQSLLLPQPVEQAQADL